MPENWLRIQEVCKRNGFQIFVSGKIPFQNSTSRRPKICFPILSSLPKILKPELTFSRIWKFEYRLSKKLTHIGIEKPTFITEVWLWILTCPKARDEKSWNPVNFFELENSSVKSGDVWFYSRLMNQFYKSWELKSKSSETWF